MKRLILHSLFALSAAYSLSARGAEAPPGQIAISPSMVEMPIGEKPVSGSIRMQNLKKEAVNIKVTAYNWTTDEQNQVKLIPGNGQSLDKWLLISPVTFTIEPGGSQVIRYSIRPSETPEAGEHRAMIFLSEEAPANVAGNNGLQVRFSYGMAMYGYSSSTHEVAELEGLSLDRNSSAIKAVVRNTGNVHTRLTGDYTIWKAGTFPGFNAMKAYVENGKEGARPAGLITSGSLHSSPVLPGQRRTIAEKLDTSGCTDGYVVAVSGKIGGRPIEKLLR